MKRLIDITGQKYGRLTCIEPTGETNKQNSALWLCWCDCGNEVVVCSNSLRRGNTKSCGCLRQEIDRKKPWKHGLTMGGKRLRLYWIWSAMKDRCFNPKNESYHRYGGRGIKVCPEWMEFEPFYVWATVHGYKDDLTIDRINNDGNYESGNCRWVTHKEQSKNTSRNHFVTFQGETKTIGDWAGVLGLRPKTLLMRIRNGWPLEKAMTLPRLDNKSRLAYSIKQ